MGKKTRKTEYFDTFDGKTWQVEGPFSEEEVITYIKDNWLGSHDAVLKDFSERKLLKTLALRYAHGDTYLKSRTQQARNEYLRLLNMDLFPTEQRRRLFDVVTERIKDALPALATRAAVEEVILSNPELSDAETASLIYKLVVEQKTLHCTVPNTRFVKNIREQMENNGGVLPEFELDMTTRFQLSVTDQLAKAERNHDDPTKLVLTVKMKRKSANLIFKLPDKKRFTVGKVSLPDIMRTSSNESGVMFKFSVRHAAPEPYIPQCSLGADLGVIFPVVSALVGNGWYSQAFYPDGELLDLVDKLNDLAFQKAVVDLKAEQDSMPGRIMHKGQKQTYEQLAKKYACESERLTEKITDIKGEIARRVAHMLCETAMSHKAQIVFEKLNWSDPSHAFFYSMMQEKTENLALASGIPVIFVSAKDTSAKCAHDGAELKQRRAEKPPAVKLGTKQRNGWRSVDRKSGLRDAVIKHEIVEKSSKCKSKTNEFSVPFPEVESRHEEKASTVLRGAFCPIENVRRDHDCVGARNLGLSGEVERGTGSSCFSLRSYSFRRVHRRDRNIGFGWAVVLSATAAVSASAPVISLADVSNEVVGLVDSGSPPS